MRSKNLAGRDPAFRVRSKTIARPVPVFAACVLKIVAGRYRFYCVRSKILPGRDLRCVRSGFSVDGPGRAGTCVVVSSMVLDGTAPSLSLYIYKGAEPPAPLHVSLSL